MCEQIKGVFFTPVFKKRNVDSSHYEEGLRCEQMPQFSPVLSQVALQLISVTRLQFASPNSGEMVSMFTRSNVVPSTRFKVRIKELLRCIASFCDCRDVKLSYKCDKASPP